VEVHSQCDRIIEAVEPQRRGLYCGAIGYVGCDGDMDLNIRSVRSCGTASISTRGPAAAAAPTHSLDNKAAAMLRVMNARESRPVNAPPERYDRRYRPCNINDSGSFLRPHGNGARMPQGGGSL